jgi:hypothetical protein
MNLRNITLALTVMVAGTAFAATERTVIRETPDGTVTKHVVTRNNQHRIVKKTVIKRAPHHNRHHARNQHPRKVVIVRQN